MSGKAYAFVVVPSVGSKSIGGCGRCDEDNPAAIERHQLQQWVHEGVIEWWEHRDDIPVVLASATVVTLPSYREGLPVSLLEAAACGKAIIATDVPGCREVVRHRVNGPLVLPGMRLP
jgi:glycosyltransferase involved in cell wall biosynthesis